MEKSFSKYKDVPKYITKLSWENRNNPTPQEEKLWLKISGKKLNGLKFRRQFPIGRYVVDFYNHANRLVVEIDGSVHDSTKEYDANRDAYLRGCNCIVLRFTNNEIESCIETVMQRILENAKDAPRPPQREKKRFFKI